MKLKTYLRLGGMIAVISLVATTIPIHAATDGADKRVESTFKDSLVYNSYLRDPGENVNIQSDKGVVTLSGTVSNEADKTLAETTAASISGVNRVENKLAVSGERAEGNSDAWIATKIKTTLMFHRNVSGLKTVVDVKDGIVTLKGEAENLAQKDLTARYAEDTEGVKGVRNNITVVASKEKSKETVSNKVDDASITAQVKMALLFHRSTSALRTDVDSKEGVVTLHGRAKNGAEKDLVTKLVSDIYGVQKVVNNMTVDVNTQG